MRDGIPALAEFVQRQAHVPQCFGLIYRLKPETQGSSEERNRFIVLAQLGVSHAQVGERAADSLGIVEIAESQSSLIVLDRN
jgi:hypothetical protein